MRIFKTLRLCSLLLLAATVATAAVPNLINYQGLLTDNSNPPQTVSGQKNFFLKIFDAATGGTELYTESIGQIMVVNGVYSFTFGSGITNELSGAGNQFWLELSVDGIPQTTRERLVSVPFALKANVAENVAPGSVTSAGLALGAAAANLSASGGIIMSEQINNSALSSLGFNNIGPMPLPGSEVTVPLSTSNAPTGNLSHIFWRDPEMITVHFDTVNRFQIGRYNKTFGTWTTSNLTTTHLGRVGYSAVLAGNEIIVWGGYAPSPYPNPYYNTGFSYNLDSETVTPIQPTTNTPSARAFHLATVAGDKMIIWGGRYFLMPNESIVYYNTGAMYDLTNKTWQAMNVDSHTPVVPDNIIYGNSFTNYWTGSKVVVWGHYLVANSSNVGIKQYIGAMFDPINNNWETIASQGAPTYGPYDEAPATCWTGTEMLVWWWGNSKRFKPSDNTWHNMSYQGAPPATTSRVAALWNGTEMTLSAPALGYTYNPTVNKWTYRSGAGVAASSVWTGDGFLSIGSFQQLGKVYYLYQK